MRVTNVGFTEGAGYAAEGVDARALLTERDPFRGLDLGRMKQLMNRALMVDPGNVYRSQEARGAGSDYVGVGKP